MTMKRLSLWGTLLLAAFMAVGCATAPNVGPRSAAPTTAPAVGLITTPVNPSSAQAGALTAVEIERARQAAVPRASEWAALMKRDGKPFSVTEFLQCMDPATRDACGRGFYQAVTWQTYAPLFAGHGVTITTFEQLRVVMLSGDLGIVPCSREILKDFTMWRIHKVTKQIDTNYHRRDCYADESIFTFKGVPLMSNVCANGMQAIKKAPSAPGKKKVPACVDAPGKPCKGPPIS